MSEHTKTPWQSVEVRTQVGRAFRIGAGEMLAAGKGSCIIYDDYPGNPDNERKANAEFIVRAVNSHDEMLDVLKRIHTELVRQDIKFGPLIADAEAVIAKAEARARIGEPSP